MDSTSFIYCSDSRASLGESTSVLAFSRPLQGATGLIVEGWLPPFEVRQCAELFREGDYEIVLVASCVNMKENKTLTMLERTRKVLIENGVDKQQIFVIDAGRHSMHRTYFSALAVRNWFSQQPHVPQKVDVVSGGAHSRKTYTLYKRVLSGIAETGALSVKPGEYDPDYWFLSRVGLRYTIYDFVGYLYALTRPVPFFRNN